MYPGVFLATGSCKSFEKLKNSNLIQKLKIPGNRGIEEYEYRGFELGIVS